VVGAAVVGAVDDDGAAVAMPVAVALPALVERVATAGR